MSSGAIALLVGTVLAVGALAFVLHPLFFSSGEVVSRRPEPRDAQGGGDTAIVALREIEFDRATGKLSDVDYAELRTDYAERAVRELRAANDAGAAAQPPIDEIEARISAYRQSHRECATCGLRPEQDAIYCSSCGGYLERVCPECAAPVTESSAVFCSTCGGSLSRPARRVFA